MQKFIIGGFVVLMAVLGLGADVYFKWRDADGDFGPAEYLASFLGPTEAQRARTEAADAAKTPLRDLLPDAPDGWTRRPWEPADDERLKGTREISADEQEMLQAVEQSGAWKTVMAMDRNNWTATMQARSFVYQRGADFVLLEAKREDDSIHIGSRFEAETYAGAITDTTMNTGFAHFQGVSWLEKGGAYRARNPSDPMEVNRTFQARLGREIKLQVSARASDDAVREVMAALDYPTLNAAQAEPAPGVSTEIPALTVDQQILVADAWAQQRMHQRNAEIRAALEAYQTRKEPTFLDRIMSGVGKDATLEAQAEPEAPAPRLHAPSGIEKLGRRAAEIETGPSSGGFSMGKLFGKTQDKADSAIRMPEGPMPAAHPAAEGEDAEEPTVQDIRAQIKVNRPDRGRKAHSSCGGGAFCRVTGN